MPKWKHSSIKIRAGENNSQNTLCTVQDKKNDKDPNWLGEAVEDIC